MDSTSAPAVDCELVMARLARVLENARSSAQRAAATRSAMRFFMSPAARGLQVGKAARLQLLLARALLSLDVAAGGWAVEPGMYLTRPLLEDLRSADPLELRAAVQAAMEFLASGRAQAVPHVALEELFCALGGAQSALREQALRRGAAQRRVPVRPVALAALCG